MQNRLARRRQPARREWRFCARGRPLVSVAITTPPDRDVSGRLRAQNRRQSRAGCSAVPGRFCTPLYGDFFVKRFFTRTLIFFASLVPFLRSVSLFDRGPFLRPDLLCRRDAARSCGQGWPVFGPPPEAARNASLTAASTVSRCTGSGRMDRSWRAAARRYALSDQRGACGLVGEFPRLTTLYAVSRARARP